MAADIALARDPSRRSITPLRSTREQASGVTTASAAPGSLSAWAAPERPSTFRAYSMTACWNPPQVPRKGMWDSRAWRMAHRAPAMLAYGLAGTHHTPSNGSRKSPSGWGIDAVWIQVESEVESRLPAGARQGERDCPVSGDFRIVVADQRDADRTIRTHRLPSPSSRRPAGCACWPLPPYLHP